MTTRLKVLIGVVSAIVLVAAAGIWWFLRDDAPAEVSLAAAVESVAGADPGGDATASGSDAADGIEGSWVVDTATGEFDFESATGTFAGFRIEEELASIGSTTAVGRTGDVTGSITIEGTTLTAASFEVDMTTITTNESGRDDRVQEALETADNPTGSFTLPTRSSWGTARRPVSPWPSPPWETSPSTASRDRLRSRSRPSSSTTRWS
jgi:polyisoprenoid-binding protein YceI